ncbi:DUF938 domain-containing protein [Aurantiacibacter spongiae]|uniref:DUF938 domain-containing protein n=1 Tax=Aurantiacibacter spongiae TaxID=2488860 RepID=UPI0026C57C14|nr:DUF938 domain-containing protein [Aurantiacibacter spongiae]
MKRHAPAADRNCLPIARELARDLPGRGTILEVASGTGQHAVTFARAFKRLIWQPSDCSGDALASIAAWRADSECTNLLSPLALDAASPEWPVEKVDAMVCINMVHISAPETTEGLFAGAGRLLAAGDPLILYGPFFEEGVDTASSNIAFDESLRARDASWGLRRVEWVDSLARRFSFIRARRAQLPANNILLVYRKEA